MNDHRTDHERSDYERVLRGEIEGSIDAELQRKRKEKSAAQAAAR